MTETKGTLVIKGQRTNLDFEFTSGEYKLIGVAQSDNESDVMIAFNAQVRKLAQDADGNTTETPCGSVATTYTPSEGEDALEYNCYNMSRKTLKAIGDIIEDCTEQLNELLIHE
ncbi:MAG: hypothetical protein IJS06_06245 [Prevotella sp.]|nr:hypothetical protein [Prevotella sp.]